MSRKILTFYSIIYFICADAAQKQSLKEEQERDPLFENVPQQNLHQSNRKAKSKEIDGRKPIDEDKTIRQLIFPGTKWCGQGNIATHYGDFGIHQATDMCCRNHDYCPDYISAGQTKYGLTNRAPYTKVHCDCEVEFKNCLKTDNSKTSDEVGHLYFDYFGHECFKLEFPITACNKYSEDLPRRCLEYELEESQQQQWQFFDNQYYD